MSGLVQLYLSLRLRVLFKRVRLVKQRSYLSCEEVRGLTKGQLRLGAADERSFGGYVAVCASKEDQKTHAIQQICTEIQIF
jgi:hypothetical protein